ELDADAGCHLVANNSVLYVFPVVLRVQREETDLGRLGVNAVGAHDLARGFSLFGSQIVGILRRIALPRDVELNQRRVWSSLEFSIGANVDRVGQGRHRWGLSVQSGAQNENATERQNGGFHEVLLQSRSQHFYPYTPLDKERRRL